MSEQGDLHRALKDEAAAIHGDDGTTATHPTKRKGQVTEGTAGSSIACQVDGKAATNITGHRLYAGDVVWMINDQGRRHVMGMARLAGSGGEIVIGAGQMVSASGPSRIESYGASATAQIPVAVLAASGNSSVVCSTAIPPDWTAWDIDVWWMQIDSGTGNVRFQVRHNTTDIGSVVAAGSPESFTESAPGRIREPAQFTPFAGVARADGVWRCQIHRQPGDSLDTFDGEVGVVQVVLRRA